VSTRTIVAAGVVAILVFARSAPAAAQAPADAALAVVVAADASIDSVSLGDLRRIFLGDRQFTADRTRITLIVPAPSSPGRATALRVIFRMREVEYRQYWVAKIFRADVISGPRVANAEQAKRQVASLRGAIALIPASAVDRTVKVVVVNGRRPGQAGYELQ
jgi:hypothetical protein